MAKDPAFLFYSSDFLTGTMIMSNHQKGQYITILCGMHQHGRLTLDEINILLREDVLPGVLKKFSIDEHGLYFNEKLEEVCEKRKNFSESRRNSLKIDNGDMVHLYILHDPKTGNYKIGSSKYPPLRLTELQKTNPEIRSYWVSECLVERINEKKLHDKFRSQRVKYDWFKLSKQDLENIAETFRTVSVNVSRTENENENRDENSLEDRGMGKGDLSELEAGKTVEFCKITLHRDYDTQQIFKLWEAFLINGKKGFYNNSGEIVKHFRNWIKSQPDLKKSNGTKGTSEARTERAKTW